MKIIYCRGGDKDAPGIAKHAQMLYGIQYSYTPYSKDIYMIDAGLKPKWSLYIKRLRKFKPHFALTPDYLKPDPIMLDLRIMDMQPHVKLIGICPKFLGAVHHFPKDAVICESVPSEYAGWLIPDCDILPNRDYHLLGGDPVIQKTEITRIESLGGNVISVDGNKIAFKAAHGQIFDDGRWVKTSAPTIENATRSALNLVNYLNN